METNYTQQNPSPISILSKNMAEIAASILGRTYTTKLADGITLTVCPGKEISWAEFEQVAPPYSIALDGFVRGAPRYDKTKKLINFNHHQDVDRLSTRSTSGQVLVAIKQGLIEAFSVDGSPILHIFVNDPDQDSSLAVWLLKNHERIAGAKSEPLLGRLINAEDLIDTTAGAFPFDPNSSLMREMAWVFDPYVQARMSGRLRTMEGAEMANVIDVIGSRISSYSLGNGEKLALNTQLEIIGGGDGWQLIKEHGFYARTELFHRKIFAFISYLGESDGRFHYSIGKMSPFIPFPIQDIYAVLNHHENLDMNSGICWNGGDITGGSPRRVGSSLSPKVLESRVNEYLSALGSHHH
jgi:hypothetical protein